MHQFSCFWYVSLVFNFGEFLHLLGVQGGWRRWFRGLGDGEHFYCIYGWVDWVWYGYASPQGHESSVYKVVLVLVLVLVENC